MKCSSRSFVSAILVLTIIAASPRLRAETWQDGGDSLWDNPANWDFGVPTSGSTAVFDATGSTTVDLGGASHDLFDLVFNFGAQGYTLTGNAGDKLNFSSGGSINSNASVAEFVNSAIGLNGGPFAITNDGSGLLTLGGGMSLTSGAANLLNVGGFGDTTINGPIASGTITGLTKTGAGTLTLGAANSYTGTTTITEGTIATTADGALGSGAIVIGNVATPTTTTGNLIIGGNETHSSLSVATNSATANTITIGAGKKLTVNGAFTVGVAGADINTGLTASGGTLEVNNTSANVNLGLYTATGTSGFVATVDLKGLEQFKANVANFLISSHPTPTARIVAGEVYLSNTNNEITATKVSIGDTNGTTSTGAPALFLGDGTTTINTDTLIIGQGNGRGSIEFENASGSLVLNGKGGAGTKVAITIGNKSLGTTGTINSGLGLYLAGHTATVNASLLEIGKQSAANSAYSGTLEFGGGTFNVDTIDMANRSGGGTGSITGSLVVSDGTFTVNPGGSVTLGSRSSTAANSSVATIDITGGVFISNVDLKQGTGTSVTSTLTLDGGTLDMKGKSIGLAGGLITNRNFRSGTLSNVLQINNGAGLTKSTGGTLNLTGANSFTGPVAVSGGVLNLQTSSQLNLGSGSLSVNDSTLGITAFSTSSSIVTSTGTITFGSSTGSTININLIGTPTAPIINSTGAFNVNGTNVINFTTTSPIASGDYKIVDYGTGAGIGGATGFAGLSIGSMPFRTTITPVNNTSGTSFDIHVVADPIRWDGTSDGIWDINSTSNWKQSVSLTAATYQEPSPPAPGEAVTFDDAAADHFNITASQAVNPISMTFNNNVQAYSFDGAGISTNTININGSGNVSVTGGNFAVTGTLTKGGAGTLEFSNSGATLSLAPSVTINSGILAFNRTDDLIGPATITGSITGAGGTLLKQNTNIVALSGNNSGFAGTADVEAGTLRIAGPTALTTTNVQNNATLHFDLGASTPGGGTKAVSIIGNGVGGNGALVVVPTSGTADVNARIGALTLNGNARIAATNSGGTGVARLFVDGAITGGGFNLHAVVDRISNAGNEIDLINNGVTGLNNITITGNGALWVGKNTDLGSTGLLMLGDGTTGGQIGLYAGNSPDALTVAFNKPIKVAASSVGGIAVWQNPNETVGSPVAIDGTRLDVNVYVRSNNTTGRVTLAGDITGAGGLAAHLDANATASRLGLVELTSDNNTYAGPTVVGGGGGIADINAANDRVTLSIGNGGATGSIGSAGVTVNALGTLQFNRNNALNLSHSITGGGNIAQAGTGATTLTGIHTYTGSTTVANGTLIKGAATAIGSGPLVFGGNQTSTTGNLDLTTFDQTVSSLTVQSNNTTANTITIASGKKLTVNGAFTVGVAGADINTSLTATGGTLEVNNTSADVNLGLFTATGASGGLTATTDLKGLEQFKANVANFFIAAHPTPTARTVIGKVYLSNASNEITADKFSFTDSTSTAGGGATINGTSELFLGDGATTINTDTLILGQGNGRGNIGFENASGSLVLNGKGGSGTKVAITIGNKSLGTTDSGATARLNLAGHTATVNASTLTVGKQSAANSTYNGRLDFGGGTFNVDTVDLANRSGGGTGRISGRLDVSGGTFTVNPDATPGFGVTLGSQAGTVATVAALATINVTGGIFTVNGDILQGPITGPGTLDSNITVSAAGTLNTIGTGGVGAIAIGTGTGATGTFTVDGGSVHASGPIQMGLDPGGEGTFVMNSGTVTCDDWVVIGTFGGVGHGTQHGGTINTVNFDVAQSAGSNGDYTMDESNGPSEIIASGFFAVGDEGTGTFDLNKGTTSSGGWTYVGWSGNGTFNIGDGTHTAGDNFSIGTAVGAVGQVNMTTHANATINVTGNAAPYTGNVVVGDHGNGTLNMTTGKLNMTTGNTGTNNSASYSVSQAGGNPLLALAVAQDGNLSIAEEEGIGVADIGGDAIVNVAANVFVGGADFDPFPTIVGGYGTLTISGTAEVHVGTTSPTGGDLVLGSPANSPPSTAIVNLTGGLLDVAHSAGGFGGNIGAGGIGSSIQFNFTGGTLKTRVWNAPNVLFGGDLGHLVQNGSGSVLDVTGNNTALLQSSDYALIAGTANIGGGHTLTAANVTNDFGGVGTINVGNGPSNPPGDYNLDTKVDAADFVTWRKNPGSFPGNAYDVWRQHFGETGGVGFSGTLDVGAGTVDVDTLNLNNGEVKAANVMPGILTGTGTITGALSLGSGSTVELHLGGTSLGSYDQIDVTGILSADGELKVTFSDFTLQQNDSFDIFDFTPADWSGNFSSFDLPGGVGSWDTSQLSFGGSGVITYTSATPLSPGSGTGLGDGGAVPEPSALAFIALAGMALAGRRRA